MKKHNFSAGPSILDESVIRDAASAVLNYEGTGLSILEVSHRAKEFTATMEEARRLMKELLDIPEGYEVLFLGGGASLQFAQVPMNLLKKKAAYVDSGTWANKAAKEAKLFGEVVSFSSKEDNYIWYPKPWLKGEVPSDVDYLHITSNNTVYGTELRYDPDVNVRLVGDMSSDIFTREVDFSKYDLVYGGAQKNIAPAGVTFVIVRPHRRQPYHPHDAGLPDPCRQGFDVQHSSCLPHLCSPSDHEVVQGAWRCQGSGKDEHREGCLALRRNRSQPPIPWYGQCRGSLDHERLLRPQRRV